MKRCVLITGATGVIGSALPPVLLEDPETEVRLLIRARDPAHLDERLADLARFWEIAPEKCAGRVTALRGDVLEARLGLGESAYERLAKEITHIVHAAGSVRLDHALDEARCHAVGGARNVLELAARASAVGRFEKLEYLSTVGVAGRMPGPLPERALGESRCFHNSYEQAKAEAEELVRATGAPFAVTVHRPSMVVGDSRSGKVAAFQVFYHLADWLTGRKTFGFVPDLKEVRLDLVPVDYVARAIAVSIRHPEARGRVFHLCGGPEHSPRLADLAAAVRERFAADGERLPRLRALPIPAFRRLVALARCFAIGRARRRLGTLPYFLSYLEAQPSFANAHTRAFMASKGLQVPSAKQYLPAVLNYYCMRTRPAACLQVHRNAGLGAGAMSEAGGSLATPCPRN